MRRTRRTRFKTRKKDSTIRVGHVLRHVGILDLSFCFGEQIGDLLTPPILGGHFFATQAMLDALLTVAVAHVVQAVVNVEIVLPNGTCSFEKSENKKNILSVTLKLSP